jgi:hypothetical protein
MLGVVVGVIIFVDDTLNDSNMMVWVAPEVISLGIHRRKRSLRSPMSFPFPSNVFRWITKVPFLGFLRAFLTSFLRGGLGLLLVLQGKENLLRSPRNGNGIAVRSDRKAKKRGVRRVIMLELFTPKHGEFVGRKTG